MRRAKNSRRKSSMRIRQALFTHHVLVIRDQSLTPEEQIRPLAQALGHVAPPESRGSTTHDETYVEIQALGSPRPEEAQPPDPRPSQADTWHTDYSYLPDPPGIAFLYGVVLLRLSFSCVPCSPFAVPPSSFAISVIVAVPCSFAAGV